MSAEIIKDIVTSMFAGQPAALAAALSEVETCVRHNAWDHYQKTFAPDMRPDEALLAYAIRRGSLWIR